MRRCPRVVSRKGLRGIELCYEPPELFEVFEYVLGGAFAAVGQDREMLRSRFGPGVFCGAVSGRESEQQQGSGAEPGHRASFTL